MASVSSGELIGYPLETRVCQVKTKEAVSALVELIDHSKFQIKENILLKKEAYEFHKKHDLPTVILRKYRDASVSSTFGSCEGAILSYIKVGNNGLEPLMKLSQLSGADPTYSKNQCSFCIRRHPCLAFKKAIKIMSATCTTNWSGPRRILGPTRDKPVVTVVSRLAYSEEDQQYDNSDDY